MTPAPSPHDLEGKVALVVGGSRNQGAACAELLAMRGAATVISYAHGEHAAARTLAALDRYRVNAEAIRSDATRSADVDTLFEGVVSRHGRLDIVVHAVGAAAGGLLSSRTDDDFDRLIDINVRSAFNTLRAAAHHLADHGRYVALTSALNLSAPAGFGLFSASKAAVERLVQAGANELAARDITVNAVAPGPVTDSFVLGTDSAGLWPPPARGRLGQPEDIASVVGWLASAAADWVSGQTIRVDGGAFRIAE
ncbi:SDR family oxidoreductase [Nocardia sp. NBC_01009]|uniref:SDR family oxidoreductase n=1 Tax=Nocardia sp. NBC_01009 TaxID=2975996 RepID=UPI00386D2EA6|nr:SDR family oxidoreductase [Nocardia sp. NBC_01009]